MSAIIEFNIKFFNIVVDLKSKSEDILAIYNN